MLIALFVQFLVPEYDISHPYQSNEQGEFVTYSMYSHTRNKRDIEPQASPFYIMDAFGTKLHLKLKRNDHLLAPGMTVLRRNNDGTTTIHPAPANTFYLGQVASDPKSMIAVSNHGGLVRGFCSPVLAFVSCTCAPGARFSKVPKTFRVRIAICETANHLFWKADL